MRLTNAGAVKKTAVSVPYSSHLEAIARKLHKLGYVGAVSIETNEKSPEKRTLEVGLVYGEDGKSKIHGVKRISKPGRRLYISSKEVHGVKNGMGARIISTPAGILSDREARKVAAGGEAMFEIW